MGKVFKYKCMFSSRNDLNGELSHYNITVNSTSIKEVMKTLRGLGFHLGKDFVYWKFA